MKILPLAGLIVASASSAVLAQGTCGVGPAAPYRQNAVQPAQQLPVTPTAPVNLTPPGTGVLVVPSTPTTPISLPPAPSVPQFSNPTTLGTGGSQQQVALALPGQGTSTSPAAGTVFSDNFANGIDQSKWGFNYPWSDTCDTNGNADATQYAAYLSPNCSSQPGAGGVFSTVANGLSIAIKPTPGGVDAAGKPYVSGQLYSKQAVNVGQYVEVTAKLPTGSGLGGAFWLLNKDGSWPPELDVFESQGENPNSVTQTMHDGTPGNVSNDQVVANVSGTQSGFHTYGMDRQANVTTFYVDGKATGHYNTPASLQGPMYMILSTNASPPGSQNWHGTVAPGTPATDFQVQNVRVLNSVPY